jgi:CelD/BcsL family acetyltransferase involved in cellulose biosynthesis
MNKGKLNKVAANQNTITVEIHHSNQTDIQEIEDQWLELQLRSTCHFFLSWDWIGPWIKQCKGPFYIIKAYCSGQVVALAFIFEKKRKFLGFYSVNQWWLNRTGDEKYDQVWIEYNDFLIDQAFESAVRSSLIEFISKQTLWDEFVCGMMLDQYEHHLSHLSQDKNYLIEDMGYQVNLTEVNQKYTTEILSRNTRQKINQTRRMLELQGELAFRVLTTAHDKLLALVQIKRLHTEKWQDTATPSGFTNPVFVGSIEDQVICEYCEISTLSLDDTAIGFLVNYIYKGRVYFYLSALCTSFDGTIKLGMYLHSLSIEHYKEAGMKYYDFLAGKSRYKQSLTNASYIQNMLCYQKSNMRLKIETWLKRIKSSL